METGNWYLLVGRFISRPNGQIETVGVVANCWNLKLKRGSTQNNCWQTTSLLQNHRQVKTLHFTTPVFLLWLGWGTKGFGSHRVLALVESENGTSSQNVMIHLQWSTREGTIAESTSVFWLKILVLLPQTRLEIVPWSPWNITKTLKHRLEQWSLARQPFPL